MEAPPVSTRIYGSDILRIGFLTDLHIRSSRIDDNENRALNPKFNDKLEYFENQMRRDFQPDLIVVNGDVIEGTGEPSQTAKKELKLCKNLLSETKIPLYWVLGNHDLRAVT
jgi:metallophosphoesterase superfamily enzyme